ncbi:MAG: hypothetical protein JO041_05500 [Acidobacteria bacterium]|nr:hypothetical protein [Acidobacteriota bacterium]
MAIGLGVTAMPSTQRMNWSAVWAGVFCIYAIWAVFGSLGLAVFASAGTTNVVGLSLWSVVLTSVACYAGGHIAGRLSNSDRRPGGAIHGLATFGVAITGFIMLVSLAGAVLSGGQGAPAANPARAWTDTANIGWGGFVSLLLGWIFAMMGGAAGAGGRTAMAERTSEERNVLRPAA